MVPRQGLIIFVNHLKHAKTLRKYGHVYYISKKMKYVVLYLNQEDVEQVTTRLLKLPFVKKITPSERPFINTEYENSKPDKAKEYDYKIGL